MAIDPATLYSTGYPSIGTEYRFRDGIRARVEDVFIRKQDLERQRGPRVVMQFFDQNNRKTDRNEYPCDEITNWCASHGAKVHLVGKYEVVSPRVIP